MLAEQLGRDGLRVRPCAITQVRRFRGRDCVLLRSSSLCFGFRSDEVFTDSKTIRSFIVCSIRLAGVSFFIQPSDGGNDVFVHISAKALKRLCRTRSGPSVSRRKLRQHQLRGSLNAVGIGLAPSGTVRMPSGILQLPQC